MYILMLQVMATDQKQQNKSYIPYSEYIYTHTP